MTSRLSTDWRQQPITLEVLVLVGLAVLIGTRFSVGVDAPVGSLMGIALAPVWLSLLARYRLAGATMAVLLACIATGVLLSQLHAPTHSWTTTAALSRSAMIVGLVGGFGALLYVGVRVGVVRMTIAYGFGMLIGTQLGDESTVNAWRFTYSIPVAIFVLAVLSHWRSVVPQVAALVALAAIGVLNDARSNSAMLLLAAVILVWQRFGQAVSPGRRRAGNLVGVLLFGLGIFQLAQMSILEGFFGEATRERTEAQLEASGGFLLLGGRPEAAASAALIGQYPLGLGSGTSATLTDVMTASTAMSQIGYDPNNNYVRRFLFGGAIEVHSVIGDFWIWFGLAGVAACILMIALVVRGLEGSLRNAALTGLYAYLSIRFVWDMLFSPASSTMKTLTLTLPIAAIIATAAYREVRKRSEKAEPTSRADLRRSLR